MSPYEWSCVVLAVALVATICCAPGMVDVAVIRDRRRRSRPAPEPPEPHKVRHERDHREWAREFNGLLREYGCDVQWSISGGQLHGRECTKHMTRFRHGDLCPLDPFRYTKRQVDTH